MTDRTTINQSQEPEVSVMVITYNQSRYIRQTLDSILMQRTNFIYEVILADDCSNDGTREICLEYQNKYPQQIKLLLHQVNMGAKQNAIHSLRAATGNYVALCEGDDYWTDPLKLQMQRDFLQDNSSYTGIFTKVLYVNEKHNEISVSHRLPPEIEYVDFGWLLQENVINTCSFMFKRKFLDVDRNIFSILENTMVGDYALFLGLAMHGNIYYLQKVTAAYRINVGITSKWDNLQKIKNRLVVFSLLNKYYNLKKYRSAVYATKKRHYRLLTVLCLQDKKFISSGIFLIHMAIYSFLSLLFKSDYKINQINDAKILKTLFNLVAGWQPLKKLKRFVYRRFNIK